LVKQTEELFFVTNARFYTMNSDMKWNVGCSGFYYPDWKGIFYPADLPQSKWFKFYTEHFKTLELNNTFYRFPKIELLKSWYNKSPESFLFSVKAPRIITHFDRFVNCENLLSDFYTTVEQGLKEKIGCILFQLPPQIDNKEETLTLIIENLNLNFLNVIEFRHRSWWNENVYQCLAEKNICFCSISHPDLPDDFIPNTSIVYYRFHGTPKLYSSKYPDDDLQKVYAAIQKNGKTKQAFIYFNNTMAGTAIENAKQLQNIILKNN
jgi:uncharacterized protein YecE (DUF72 family)